MFITHRNGHFWGEFGIIYVFSPVEIGWNHIIYILRPIRRMYTVPLPSSCMSIVFAITYVCVCDLQHNHTCTHPPTHTRPRSLNICRTILGMFNDCGSQRYPLSCCVLGQQTSTGINLSAKPVMSWGWSLSDGNVWEEVIQATLYLGQSLPPTLWCDASKMYHRASE